MRKVSTAVGALLLLVTGASLGAQERTAQAAQAVGIPTIERNRAAEPTVTTAPLPSAADPDYPEAKLHDVACTTTGTCFAVGSYFRPGADLRALVETLQAGQWTASELPMPRDAMRDRSAELTAVSCAGSSLCVAVGSYKAKGRGFQPLAATWDGSRWSATSPRLPADREFKTIAPLNDVSCGGPRACVAVGSYSTPTATARPLMVTLRGGRWTSAAGHLPRRAYRGELVAVDCAAPRSCVAVGSTDRSGGGDSVATYPASELLSGTVWRSARPPVPKKGRGSVVSADLTAVSCPSMRRCTAVGDHYRPLRLGAQNWVLVDVLSPRGWKAGLVEPPGGARNHFVSPYAVSCPGTRTCVGVGTHSTTGAGQPVVARMRGRNGSALVVPPPTDASTPIGKLYGVTCGASPCLAVGYIEAQEHRAQGLIVKVSGGSIGSSVFALPADAQEGSLKAVAIQSSTTAVAVGYAGTQGLLVSGIGVD